MQTDLENKRDALKGVYPKSMAWYDKIDKMSDKQVTAVYLKFKEQGKVK